jgi:hypothetical protein
MKTIEDYEVRIPDYALSYLVNNDASGLEAGEQIMIDNFMQYFYDRAKELKGYVIFDTTEDEGSFVHFPAFGLACNAVKCVILICVNE